MGDFTKERNIILTVKYADGLVLLAQEENLLQGMIAKVLWNGNRCEKSKGNGNLEATRLSGDCDRPNPEQNKEYFDFLVNMITYDSSFTRDTKSNISIAKAAFISRAPFTSKLDLNLRMKQVKCYILSKNLCGAEGWELREVDRKELESFEMWCCSRVETDRVRNEEILNKISNILHARN